MKNPTNNKERGDSLNQKIAEAIVKANAPKLDGVDHVFIIQAITTALTKAREDERARCVEKLNKADFYPLCNTLSWEVSQVAIKAIRD